MVDVLPAERRQVLQQFGIEELAVPSGGVDAELFEGGIAHRIPALRPRVGNADAGEFAEHEEETVLGGFVIFGGPAGRNEMMQLIWSSTFASEGGPKDKG
jgi:hypothetical protein